MVIRFIVITSWIAAALLCDGCYNAHFSFSQKEKRGDIDCHILSGIGTVETSGDSIMIYPGARMTARKLFETFHDAEFWTRVTTGNAMRVRLRSTDLGDSVGRGVCLTLGHSTSTMQVGTAPAMPIAARLDSGLTHVGMYSEGGSVIITVGLDTVFRKRVEMPATDVIAFESVDSSEVHIRALTLQDLREEYYVKHPSKRSFRGLRY